MHESTESNAAMNDAETDIATENPMLFKSELEIATPSLSPCEARHSPNTTIINQDFLDDREDEQLDSLFLPSEIQGELSYSISYSGEVKLIYMVCRNRTDILSNFDFYERQRIS